MAKNKRTTLSLSEVEALINGVSKEGGKTKAGEPLSPLMDELAGLYGLMVFQKATVVESGFLKSEYPQVHAKAKEIHKDFA